MDTARKILDFLAFSERLKSELRHSWISDGRRESVAEHSWQMALMAMLIHRELEMPPDLLRTLQMILVHDLVEAAVGDVPFFETSERKAMKRQREAEAILDIRNRLPEAIGSEIFELWHEFERRETPEARFAVALDHLEVQVQHNLADIDSWEPVEYGLVYTKMDPSCAYDSFLKALCDQVKADAERKMDAAGIDTTAVKRQVLGKLGHSAGVRTLCS